MYVPGHFAETDLHTLHDFMRRHSFPTLVTQHAGAPFASHLPMLLDESIDEQGALYGHMARNNPQWQDFAPGAEVLVMFHGPHAYVSPSWYEPAPMAAPTWNYMAVHAYGEGRLLSSEELEQTLCRMVDEYERGFAEPWQLDLSKAMRERILEAVIGFEIRLKRIEGKFKLSQNRPEQDRRNVAAQLARNTESSEMARWMNNQLKRK